MALEAGTRVADYRIESLIGSGSTGSVYTAEDPALGRRIALKLLAPELSRDARFRDRFLRESRLAAGLEHPNVIPIHAAGETEEGQLYLAMRYVDGRDLASLLSSLGRLDPERALGMLAQIASALDAAHAEGLVHRDVKPANILVARHAGVEHVYLCDFGLAKHASTVSSLTGDRAVMGTVDYLAPELIAGKPVDGRIDVYGLGCVLYECLTGQPPFKRDNEVAALLAHVNDSPPKPSERVAELPEPLDPVIATALAKDREDRYATAGDLVAAARRALSGETPPIPAPAARMAAVRTFLFADVRGYTSYTREQGDEAGAALAERFAALVREDAPGFEGHLQELRGDEALVVFDSARQALRFALALRGRASELERPIGIGLDAGEAVPVDEGFRGGALNRAARLCSLAKPGEVLVSDAVVALAGVVEGVAYGFRRVERVKGFEKPVGVVEIHLPESAPRRELGRAVRARLLGSQPKRRLALYGGLAAALAVTAVVLSQAFGRSEGAPPGKSVAVLDVGTGAVQSSIDAGSEFETIVNGDGVLWGIDLRGGFIARIDPATSAITDRFAAAGLDPSQIAPTVVHGSIWASDAREAQLLRIDPRQPASPSKIVLPNPTKTPDPQTASGVAVTKSGIWVAYGVPLRIARVDPANNRVVLSRTLEGAGLYAGALLASDGDMLWAVERDAKHVWRLDPLSGDTLAAGRIGDDWVEDAAVAGGYLWVGLETGGGVWKLDGRATTVGKVDTGVLPWAVVPGGGSVWVANANSGTVTRIDPDTDEAATYTVGHRPLGTAVQGDRVWVSLGLSADDARSRIVGSRVLTSAVVGDPIASTDPGAAGTSVEALWLAMATSAGLMAYHVQRDGSAHIDPEIAAGLPTVSRDGLTYTFVIRKGFRFSPPSTEEVTAEDVRYSIERARAQDVYCDYILSVIDRIVVRGDRIVFTLENATGDLAARLSHPCAAVVPIATPVAQGGVGGPIPSAGPYYPDTQVFGQQIVLLRNPNYGGSLKQELDAIVLRVGYSVEEAVQAVSRGDADFVAGDVASLSGVLAPGGAIADEYGPSAGVGQRYFRSPTTTVRKILFNYTRGPLEDPALRRAISLALDRAALAEAYKGGPQSTLIPAGVPGRIEQSPVDAQPAAARARALIRGRRVTLEAVVPPSEDVPEVARVAELVRQQLARVGIQLHVQTRANPVGFAADPANGIDLLFLGWANDFPDPANSVTEPLKGVADPKLGGWWPFPDGREPAWYRAALAAQRITGVARAPAFHALDRRLSRVDVPAAVYAFELGRPVFFSDRVGCQRFLPLWDGLPDLLSLCLK